MDSLYNQSDFSDVTLILIDASTREKTPIRAHKAILANASEYFRGLFSSKFKEGLQDTIELEVPSTDVAVELLRCMYCKDVVVPIKLRELADMWLISDVDTEKIKYPSPPSNFVYGEGRWDKDENASMLYRMWYGSSKPIRSIIYRSITPNSIIHRLHIYASDNRHKDIQCSIYFSRSYYKTIQEYLLQYGITTTAYEYHTSYAEYEAKTIIELLINNNSFEEEDIQQIKDIFNNKLYV